MKTTVEGTYGHLELVSNGDGTWSYKYVLDANRDQAIQGLAVGETKPETFTVTATNAKGESITQTISVTIQGTNDAPVIDVQSSALKGAVKAGVFEKEGETSDTEHPGVVFTGSVKGTDIDHAADGSETDTLTYYFIKVDASGQPLKDAQGNFILTTVLDTKYGSFIIDPATGAYTYKFDQARFGSEDLTGKSDSAQVIAVDIHKAQSEPALITIELESAGSGGTGPDIEKLLGDSDLAGTAKEDGGTAPSSDATNPTQSFTGQLNAVREPGESSDVTPERVFSLVDADGNNPVQTRIDGEYGFITIDPSTGKWTYTLYNDSDAVQKLGEGQTVQEKPFYIALDGKLLMKNDGSPITIDITVKGTNDAPEITGHTNISLTEEVGGAYAGIVTGRVNAVDKDNFVDSSGTPDGTDQDRLTYTITDADGKPLTVTDGHSVRLRYGTVSINANGEYTYTVGGGTDTLGHLPLGSVAEDDFYVTVTDPHGAKVTQKIDVTINGVNHAPTVTPGAALEVTEDAANTVVSSSAGNVSMTDDKNGNALSFSTDETGNNKVQLIKDAEGYGTLQLKSDGSYTFTLNNQSDKVQGLGADETVTRTFTFWVHDREGGATQVSIAVNIHGTNDQPIASVDRVIVMNEGGNSGSTGITASDADTNDTLSFGFSAEAVAKHNEEHPNNLWTINDNGTLSTEYGTYRIDTSGGKPTVVFEIDNTADAVIALADKQLVQQTIKVDVKDSSGAANNTATVDVTVNIQGENSAPVHLVLSEAANSTPLPEDSGGTFTGKARALDLDTEAKPFYGFLVEGKIVQSVSGTYGTITIDKTTGEYTYTLNASASNATLNALAQGDKASDSFQIVAIDATDPAKISSPQTVTVNIEGQNDAPVITGYQNLSLSELSGSSTGTVSATDVDSNEQERLRYTVTDEDGKALTVIDGQVQLRYGTVTIDANGKYTYTLGGGRETLDHLPSGSVAEDDFYVTVTDPQGATDIQKIDVTINGVNHAPTVIAGTALEITEDACLVVASGEGNTSITDDKDGASLFFSTDKTGTNRVQELADPEGYGTLRLNSDGSYAFTLNNESGKVQALGADKTETRTFTFWAHDQEGGATQVSIDVKIHGTNDAPEILAVATPDGQHGTLVFSDVDAGDTHRVTFNGLSDSDGSALEVDLNAAMGSVDAYAGGERIGSLSLTYNAETHTFGYAFTPDAEYQASFAGDKEHTFTLSVTDGSSSVGSSQFSIAVAGTAEPDTPPSVPLPGEGEGDDASGSGAGTTDGVPGSGGEPGTDDGSDSTQDGTTHQPQDPAVAGSGMESGGPEHTGTGEHPTPEAPSGSNTTETGSGEDGGTLAPDGGTGAGSADSGQHDPSPSLPASLFSNDEDMPATPLAAPLAPQEGTSGGEASPNVPLHELGNELFGDGGVLELDSPPHSASANTEPGGVPVGLSEPGSMPGVPSAEPLDNNGLHEIVGGSPIVTETGSENDLTHQIAASQVQNGNG